MSNSNFRESNFQAQAIRDLKLTLEETRLAPIIEEFRGELQQAGIVKLKPHFYLSTDWGVPFPSVSIGIPFYLAHEDLVALHAEQIGHIEGFDRADILRYLRHEMGHVVNYAYKLYEDEDWVKLFGSMTQPYVEDYTPEPFSTRFVQHLPGWYAQKHPDEDWAETFAVWVAPGERWRAQYAGWPAALKKLEYCDAKMKSLRGVEPPMNQIDPDEDVADLTYSLEEYYASMAASDEPLPLGLDGSLRAVFEDVGAPEISDESVPRKPAAALIQKIERQIMANVFRWTGHFPERTRMLTRLLAERAEALEQVYPEDREMQAIVGVTTLVTSLAMTHVFRGGYSGGEK